MTTDAITTATSSQPFAAPLPYATPQGAFGVHEQVVLQGISADRLADAIQLGLWIGAAAILIALGTAGWVAWKGNRRTATA